MNLQEMGLVAEASAPQSSVSRCGDTLPLNPPRWPEPACVTARCALETLPHVMEKLCALWGEREFETYVNQLIMDSRDGKRQGLPWAVGQELLFLAELSIAKRALNAAQITGLSFDLMFERCRLSAGKIGTIPAAAPADPWSDPRSNREAGRLGLAHSHARSAQAHAARPQARTSWWTRLVG